MRTLRVLIAVCVCWCAAASPSGAADQPALKLRLRYSHRASTLELRSRSTLEASIEAAGTPQPGEWLLQGETADGVPLFHLPIPDPTRPPYDGAPPPEQAEFTVTVPDHPQLAALRLLEPRFDDQGRLRQLEHRGLCQLVVIPPSDEPQASLIVPSRRAACWRWLETLLLGPDAAAATVTAFQESGGQVVMQTEHFDGNIPRSSHDWQLRTSVSGFSGSGYMEGLPNSGTTFDSGFAANSPELVFNVQFSTTGTYYVWVRGNAASGTDNSVHAGLDGIGPSSADRLDGFGTGWTWKRTTLDGTSATLTVSSPGLHTVHLWMREDGVRVDKWLLRRSSSSTAPSGGGPAESPRVAIGDDTTAPSITNVTDQILDSTIAAVRWDTDEPATSRVEYGQTTAYGQTTPLDGSLVSQHNVTVTGLTPEQTYHYRVHSQDAAGNPAVSSDGTFTTTAAVSASFQEVGGQVVLEAEHYDRKNAVNGRDWTFSRSVSGYAASGHMVVPNAGVTINTGYVTGAPELVYDVRFTTTGTYYVWVRGAGPSGSDDSLHAGLDGAGPASADRISSFGTTWGWRRSTMDGANATLQITNPGVHTLHLWMREDGLNVDRWLLRTSSSSTAPSGAGPAETALKPRLMALGASIVQGVGDANGFGFRDHVQGGLGVRALQWVGTFQNPASDPAYDVDHEGVPGDTTSEAELRLPTALSRHMRIPNPPGSLVLLHIGTNDIASGQSESAAVQNVADIVNLLHAHDPSISVYVALIIPSTLPATDAAFQSFNEALANRLAQLRATKTNLFTVDMHAAFTANPQWESAYMSDSLHPNDAGYQVMAQTWLAAINASP